ncbi:MAG: TolC family protein, partial [bacterium]
DIENARGSVIAQWRLYDSGRRGADRRAAQQGAQAAGYSLETVRNELVFEISKAYYGLLQSREFVAVREDSVRSLEEHLRLAGERVKAGSALKTDVLNLEVQYSQAREDLIRAKNAVRLARAALNAAIGSDLVKESDLQDLSDSRGQPVKTGPDSPDTRPEWRAVQAQVAAAEAMTQRARREYLPVVNAFGSLDWDSEPFRTPERSYLVGAAVEWNIFDGFRNRAGLTRASAGLVAAQAEADKLRILLALDLTRSHLNEQESRERLEVASRSLAAAEEALRITRDRYQQGAAEVTELMTAQVGVTATKARQTAARYDNLIALADQARAAGRAAEGIRNSETGH